jgi:hypothetical protein
MNNELSRYEANTIRHSFGIPLGHLGKTLWDRSSDNKQAEHRAAPETPETAPGYFHLIPLNST